VIELPRDLSDPKEVILRAEALSLELELRLPGLRALVFKASRGIEDVYELTSPQGWEPVSGSVSVTALREHKTESSLSVNRHRYYCTEACGTEQKQLDQRLRNQQFYTRSLIESTSTR